MEEKTVSINIEQITKCIENKKCILILGPDIVFDFRKSLYNELYKYLIDKEVKCKFDSYDELFSSASYSDIYFEDEVANFFKKLQPTRVYQQIAEIPFHTIISLNPDLLLKQTFDKNNFDYSFAYYHRDIGCKPQIIAEPEKDKPLLFNYLGVFDHPSSLILCFNDLFSYLSSILGGPQLDDTISEQLLDAKYLIFLGIKFDKWYSKLILQLLNIGKNNIKQASFKEVDLANKQSETRNFVIDFYRNELKMEFIDQRGDDIIKLIHSNFKQSNALRTPKKENPDEHKVTHIIKIKGDKNIVVQDAKGNININK